MEEEHAAADSRTKKAIRRKQNGRTIARVRRRGKIERVEILRLGAVDGGGGGGGNGGGLRAAELEIVSFLMPVVEM